MYTKVNGLSQHIAASTLDQITLIFTGSLAGGIKSTRRLMAAFVICTDDFVSSIFSDHTCDENHKFTAAYYSATISQICFVFVWLQLQLFSINVCGIDFDFHPRHNSKHLIPSSQVGIPVVMRKQ